MIRHLTLLLLLVAVIPEMAADVYLNPSRGYSWIEEAADSSQIVNTTPDTICRSVATRFSGGDFRIAIAIEDLHGDNRAYPVVAEDGKRLKIKHPGYSVILTDADRRRLSVTFHTSLSGDEEWAKTSRSVVITSPDGIVCSFVPPKAYKNGKRNLLIINKQRSTLSLRLGHSETAEVWSATMDFNPSRLAVAVPPGGAVDIPMLEGEEVRPAIHEALTINEIKDAVTDMADPKAGYWRLTARQLEEKTVRSGGDYTLAVAPRPDGSYTLYYIEGAAVNPSSWHPGMVKARLIPRVNSRFDVVWYDAALTPVAADVAAIFESDEVLTIHFPYYDAATLTFQRIPGYQPSTPAVYDTTDP